MLVDSLEEEEEEDRFVVIVECWDPPFVVVNLTCIASSCHVVVSHLCT